MISVTGRAILPREAMHSADYAVAWCPSLYSSITCRNCVVAVFLSQALRGQRSRSRDFTTLRTEMRHNFFRTGRAGGRTIFVNGGTVVSTCCRAWKTTTI